MNTQDIKKNWGSDKFIAQKWCFLKKEDLIEKNFSKIFNSKTQQNTWKKVGTQAIVTDFALALKADTNGTKVNGKETGYYWVNNDGIIGMINPNGNEVRLADPGYWARCNLTTCCRPCFHKNSILPLASNHTIDENGIESFEYGSYPQDAVSKEESLILEELFNSNQLEKTNRQFTINKHTSEARNYYGMPVYFEEEFLDEYELNGRTFVKFKDRRYELNSKYIWIEVKPIKWLVIPEKGLVTPEKLIIAGVPLTNGFTAINNEGSIISCFLKDFSQQIIGKKESVKFNELYNSEEIEGPKKTK